MVKDIIQFKGNIAYDLFKPDGTMLLSLDVRRINNLGWKAKIPQKQGIENFYNLYMINYLWLIKSRLHFYEKSNEPI